MCVTVDGGNGVSKEYKRLSLCSMKNDEALLPDEDDAGRRVLGVGYEYSGREPIGCKARN